MAKTNFEMIARVRDRIAEVGDEHCDMDYFAFDHEQADRSMPGSGEPPCGTVACIAGHAVAVHRGFIRLLDLPRAERDGARILGLDGGRIEGDVPLFYESEWPRSYSDTLQAEGHAKGMLAILDDILDRKIDPNTLEPIASPSGE